MPDFNQTRNELNHSRSQRGQLEHELFVKSEKLAKTQREAERLTRAFDLDNPKHQQRKQELETIAGSLKAELEQGNVALADWKVRETLHFNEFNRQSDPRQSLSFMSDEFPFLLIPVRIEFRFKKVNIGGGDFDQLWLRIYPDDCAIDTFEPIPSESEIASLRAYWSATWQAGGYEDQERDAWRALVASYGSGRASWLMQNYAPGNAIERPTKPNKDDVVLVIATDELPPTAELDTILNFWKSMWQADGDPVLEENHLLTLKTATSEARAAEIVETLQPDNFNASPAAPLTRSGVGVSAVYLRLPAPDSIDTKKASWTQAPKVKVMPDRFVVTGYRGGAVDLDEILEPVASPLVVGPNPSLPLEDQLKQKDGEIELDDQMKWLFDFEEAERIGLGFRMNLTTAQAAEGFDRLIVLGVRLSANADESKELLEELIEHHHYSRKGLAILPQGTPTNNTDGNGSGYRFTDDPDASFDDLKKGDLFTPEGDWFKKKDGQWLSDLLGVDHAVFQHVKNAGHTDQCEAKAMNVALWPTTMGYMMDSLMQEVFSDKTIDQTRTFFNHFVSGRGMIPALKIGDQPYGILATTAFSKMTQFADRKELARMSVAGIEYDPSTSFLMGLYNILSTMDADWKKQLDRVAYIGKPGDPHQTLLDVLGLHGGSAEFHQRVAESMEDLYNRFQLYGESAELLANYVRDEYARQGKALLKKFGLQGDFNVEILEKLFLQKENLLKGPLVDDVPVSESNPIRAYTPEPAEENYIQWLIHAAQDSHDTLRRQKGFIDNKTPSSLLYLMLQHALDLGYIEVSLLLHLKADRMAPEQVRTARREPAFMHIQEGIAEPEGKYAHLYKIDSLITGSPTLQIANFIPKVLTTEVASAYLRKQLEALEHLKNVPTARLERAMVEHIDCCTYRLDAWKAGLMNYKLASMRYPRELPATEDSRKGIYLGAFGWLEDVRPENKELSSVELTPDLADTFQKPGSPKLERDNTNQGHLSAPSINQAVTAAILRNGYVSNADSSTPDLLSVNLSSERVRKAQFLIEGIRNGQSLGALLGYHLERGLHDAAPGLNLDIYIYEIRKAFPLATNAVQLEDSENLEDETSIESIEARNVVDGLALADHIRETGEDQYPFGKPLSETGLTAAQRATINEQVLLIVNLNDALADVAVAESLHQVSQGNYDRGAATLDAYSKGNFPPIPDVTATPRSGTTITHKLGLALVPGLDHNTTPNGKPSTPRSMAEPAVNHWLASILPATDKIACQIVISHPGAAEQTENVTAEQLGMQPIDLLYVIDTLKDQAMTDLDDRVIRYVHNTWTPRPDAPIRIHYTERLPGLVNLFELAAMTTSLRNIVLNSRPLEPNDVARPNEVRRQDNAQLSFDHNRLQDVKNRLDPLSTSISTYEAAIGLLVADTEANRAAILSQIDALTESLVADFSALSAFGLEGTGYGFAMERRRELYQALVAKVETLTTRWQDRLTRFLALIGEHDALPGTATDEEKLQILRLAEKQVSTDRIDDTPAAIRTALDGLRVSFEAKRDAFIGIQNGAVPSLSDLIASITAEFPLDAFDLIPLDISDQENQTLLLAQDLANSVVQFAPALTSRLDDVQVLIDAAKLETNPVQAVQAFVEASTLLLGDDFKLIPEYNLQEAQADEWQKSYSEEAQLLDHLTNTVQVDFPMDDWFYGVARVREKVHHLENAMLLSEAFGGSGIQLHPIQLPYAANDHWLGLEYPTDYVIDSDRTLFTCHYATPFVKNQPQVGLLIDEWTEVIPSKEETMGMAFHYDRPNSEPPQTMLLAMPFRRTDGWQWMDLLAIVNETLDMAKERAIEPEQIDKTSYARFLPAVVSSMTVHPITASLNYGFNNLVYNLMDGANNE